MAIDNTRSELTVDFGRLNTYHELMKNHIGNELENVVRYDDIVGDDPILDLSEINDDTISLDTTWSSEKINNEINEKLPVTGGTVKGYIEIAPEDDIPTVVLKDTSTSTEAKVVATDGSAKVVVTDSQNTVELALDKDATDKSNLVKISHTTDGSNVTYKLYGEHNKPLAVDLGAVPSSRKVNGKVLSSDITLNASDVGALPADTQIPTDTNTTYDMSASKNSANGNVKLNLTAGGDGSGTDSVTIKGTGATTVTTDANGVITISSTDTQVTVDSELKDDSTNPVQNKIVVAGLNNKLDASLKGANNGLAELDNSGKVPSSQLPSYVDDVIEGTYDSNAKTFKNSSGTAITGETGKIYVDTTTNKSYRWSGSTFIEISASLALGETSSTAFRGDHGKTAYTHANSTHAPVDAEKNQNAFSNVKVGNTTVAADTATDTFTLVAGSNVSIVADATNDTITISSSYTDTDTGATSVEVTGDGNAITGASYDAATRKITLEKGATYNNFTYTLPVATPSRLGGVKSGTDITVDASGNVSVNDDSHNHVISNIDGLQDALDGKALKSQGLFYIEGDSSSSTDTTNKVATWIGSHEDIDAYFSGLTILYKITTAGSTTTTLNINNLGAVKVVRNATTGISTSCPVDSVVMLTYTVDSDGTAYWKTADYDANTKNTAGTSNKTGTKMYIVGATSQTSSGTTTYTNTNTYIGKDNSLYSYNSTSKASEKVSTVTDLNTKQDKITGNAGDFVVIGSDGNVTTKTIAYAEEVSF